MIHAPRLGLGCQRIKAMDSLKGVFEDLSPKAEGLTSRKANESICRLVTWQCYYRYRFEHVNLRYHKD